MNRSQKNKSITIINRSFWPDAAAIGESLLILSEKLTDEGYSVSVITQSPHKNIKEKLIDLGRAKNVHLQILKARTTSSSSIIARIAELFIFSIYMILKLIFNRPDLVYISTNPPIIAPFFVMLYCKVFKKKYVYHLQDIHPEATEVVFNKTSTITNFLRKIDNSTIRNAKSIITLTNDMEQYIRKRVKNAPPIFLLNNPAVVPENLKSYSKLLDFVFCGNAGRLQRIPLLLSSIESYLHEGGMMNFTFIGSGIYSESIKKLADKYEQVTYLGFLSAEEVGKLLPQYKYGILPIEDRVTQFAFPSKSSSYAFARCRILAICGSDTSVATWVKNNNLGVVADPNKRSIVKTFQNIETSHYQELIPEPSFIQKLLPDYYVKQLINIILK